MDILADGGAAVQTGFTAASIGRRRILGVELAGESGCPLDPAGGQNLEWRVQTHETSQ